MYVASDSSNLLEFVKFAIFAGCAGAITIAMVTQLPP